MRFTVYLRSNLSNCPFDSFRIFSGGLETSWRQVFDIGKGQHAPITGLEYHVVPHTQGRKYIVIATTQTRMYQFQGNVGSADDRPLLQNVFNRYANVPEKFIELPGAPKTSNNSPSLTFFYQPKERGKPYSRYMVMTWHFVDIV